MSAGRHSFSRGLRTTLAGFAVLAISACTVEVAVPTPEEITDPGFSGDWVAPILGSQMILRIGEFQGIAAPDGRLLWRDLDWRLNCSLDRGFDPARLTCIVIPDVTGPTCSADDVEPYVEITFALPNTRIEATVGGDLRPGAGNPCDADPIASWEPPTAATFVLG